VRGDVHEFKAPRPQGHEQRGRRYAVVVQADTLPLSTWLVAPTSTKARPASFRPEITLGKSTTRVLVEQTAAVDPQRLGGLAGRLSTREMQAVDEALRIVLGLDWPSSR
jgi:mRNA interferase MazF